MLKKIKKIIAIAGLSAALTGTLGVQAHAATKTVTVHKGDTLWGIARNHHVTVSQIEKWNKLTSGLIHPGLKLIVSNDIHTTNKAVTGNQKKSVKVVKTKSISPKVYKKITVQASAYTGSCAGCSGFTSTGINLKAHPNDKIIAVDPSVIPLGSKVYVEGYGYAIAADTGGGMKGKKIDVFISSKQKAIDFGVKRLVVTVFSK
jgi:3D (Asp-Asp-Asp) domain-containing protein